MKKRILSFVLAAVMVLAMIPVAVIGANAATEMGIELKLSNYTVTPGGTALVDLYASVKDLGDNDGICNFQVYLTLPDGVSLKSEGYTFYYVGTKGVKGTVNTEEKMICASADAGEYIATAEQLTVKGGALIATIALDVASTFEDGTELEIGIASVSDFKLRKIDGETQTDSDPTAADFDAVTYGSGTVYVSTAGTGADDNGQGDGSDYTLPATNSQGQKVTATGTYQGSYGTVFYPAAVDTISGPIFAKAYVIKNTAPAKLDLFSTRKTMASIGMGDENYTVYRHVRANGQGNVDALLAGVGVDAGKIKNILSAGAQINDGSVVAYGNIAVADKAYDYVYVVATITLANGETKTKTSAETRYVYTTLNQDDKTVATTDADVAQATGKGVEGAYLYGMVVNVPSEVASVTVTAYGCTSDANGNPIIVCSDAVVVSAN